MVVAQSRPLAVRVRVRSDESLRYPSEPEAPHHLGDGRCRHPETVGQARLDDLGALLLELEDGFEVLVDRRMSDVRHGAHSTGNEGHSEQSCLTGFLGHPNIAL